MIHIPARSFPEPREEVWAFQLERNDTPGIHELESFDSALRAALPPEIAQNLRWLPRAAPQQALAQRLQRKKHPLAARVTSAQDLTVEGEVEVYHPGLTAGRLRVIHDEELDSFESQDDEILLLPALPDHLPAAAAIITAIPQTPLAHLNLLARNRGIPNLYAQAVVHEERLLKLAQKGQTVVLRASGDSLQIEAIDEASYRRWKAQARSPRTKFASPAAHKLPYSLPIVSPKTPLSPQALHRRAAQIGGKAQGFFHLVGAGVDMPQPALALTTRAFHEHTQALQPQIKKLLAHPEFQASARVRRLLLEGEKNFLKSQLPSARAWVKAFKAQHPSPSILGDVLARGGLQKLIRRASIPADTLQKLRQTLESRFGELSPQQGLRFRSSSNVEDIEGFNGAGLYRSSTGFLHAESLPHPKDKKRTLAWALKRTWASYWSWEAFEERRRFGVEHSNGAMGVLVHPRFDDPLEQANGVISFTLDRGRPGSDAQLGVEMRINVQPGALSVTNAPSGVTPEVIRVLADDEQSTPHIQRISRASRAQDIPLVLHDAEILQLYRQSKKVAQAWLQRDNRSRPAHAQRYAITLDFEFRRMESNWPLRPGPKRAGLSNLLLKQVRSLEPGPRPLPPALRDLGIPAELRARMESLEEVQCQSRELSWRRTQLATSALATPDFGRQPFVLSLELKPSKHTPTKLAKVLRRVATKALHYTTFVGGQHVGTQGRLQLPSGLSLRWNEAGELELFDGKRSVYRSVMQCQSRSLLPSRDAILLRALKAGPVRAKKKTPRPHKRRGVKPAKRKPAKFQHPLG